MANIKIEYGSATSLTVTGLSSLADNTNATSDAIANDGTGDKYMDCFVEVNVTVGTVAGEVQVLVYAIGSLDGTNYGDASDGANMRLIGAIYTPTSSTAYRSQPMSVAAGFGSFLPPKFKIVVRNESGAALTAGTAQYRFAYATSA